MYLVRNSEHVDKCSCQKQKVTLLSRCRLTWHISSCALHVHDHQVRTTARRKPDGRADGQNPENSPGVERIWAKHLNRAPLDSNGTPFMFSWNWRALRRCGTEILRALGGHNISNHEFKAIHVQTRYYRGSIGFCNAKNHQLQGARIPTAALL